MKRVAVIAIFMAVMASLFAFPVFADTPVQPLQVITYSDTTTNVRISGTAERLHYNVDSFQVVFMNPPNNYGTACTPILVSFRFYNSSDLPAYVGQAEFELTATNGTGAVNTIIYGYDQISTDLFVAESSYSTAEVGRIGIGASNDFAYYTGFVIPPHTSLYFSCIVYVNASAYGQNNTGATEDVNQVTLSSLNLYTNQISFSESYPYHNQPTDFSTIIQAIEELSDNVSTSSEMTQVIQLLTYNGTYIAPANSNAVTNTYNQTNNDILHRVSFMISNPIYYYDMELDTGNDTYYQNGFKRYVIVAYNTVTYPNDISYSAYYLNNPISGTSEYYPYVVDIKSNFADAAYFNNNYVYLKNDNITSSGKYLLKGNVLNYAVITMYLDVPLSYTPTWRNITNTDPVHINSVTNLTDTDIPYSEKSALYKIYEYVKNLYTSYTQVNGLDDIDDTAEDITDKSSTAHTQEQSYFTQNAQAIQQTGLSNYRFNGDQENGIGSVSHDFTLLWNALGGFNSIYIFSLTLSLALMILRHAPGAIRSSRRNKEE